MESEKKVKEEISRGSYVESLQLKKLSFKRILRSFKFSFDGLIYAYTHEQSLTLHVLVSIVVVLCGFIFHITPIQWVIMFVMGSLMIVVELINTSIEAVVDLVTDKYHPLAKIAKDTASAACFLADLIGFGMWIIVFGPKIIALFR